ncbi:MAG: cupin domain-containing protein [Deltaproteobacteria bacterium]|nr:cupin domain-containing protein [Deltaproteobacteria bacterium]
MIVKNVNDSNDTKIESYLYKRKPYAVKDTWIRWLSQAGPEGAPEYGLRLFTVGPKGSIPIHNHLYYQTMYILTGHISITSYDIKTNEPAETKQMGPHDLVFVPTMEPHSMVNLSETETSTFLCCIANVFEDDSI